MNAESIVPQGTPQLSREQRYLAYQKRLRQLKDSSTLREVIERELLLEFVRVNHGNINEFPLLKAQQKSVIDLMCNRGQHPGYDYIQRMTGVFMTLITRYEKAVSNNDQDAIQRFGSQLHNTEALLIKSIQGIVYGMALITDNFEEIVLRYFGQQSLGEYSDLIEKHELNENFWHAFVQQFVAKRVEAAHQEILNNRSYSLSKEKNFLAIRFLFDDILSQLNPTTAHIEKTRIQKTYELSDAGFKERRAAKMVQNTLAKGLSFMPEGSLKESDFLNAARIVCIDTIAMEFAEEYTRRVMKKNGGNDGEKDGKDDENDREQSFEFLLNQVIALGVGATLAIGMTGRNFFAALEKFIPGQTQPIAPLMRNFNINALETVLIFLMEHHFIHILREIGISEGSKIMVKSARARRVPETAVNGLASMNRIRKKNLFAPDTTREGYLLFRPRTAKQLVELIKHLSLEPPQLVEQLQGLWKGAAQRVDILVLVNLQQVARTTTNLQAKLAEILVLYGVSAGRKDKEKAREAESAPQAPVSEETR